MNKLEYAQLFTSLGIAVIPLRHRGKEPASSLMGGTWELYKTSLPTEYQIANWLWSGWQNYGIVAGWNNLVILDFDDMNTFEVWLGYFEVLNKHATIFEVPFMVKTVRGAHVYITLPTGVANSRRRGVDVKIHGYVVGPGCTHPSGAIYTLINTEMVFPIVWDLETILPSELFPPVAAIETEYHAIALPFAGVSPDTEYAYDPFAVASQMQSDIDLITKVKQSVRIEALFPDAYKTSVDGRWLACKCIFHDDNKPSAWIDTRRQLYGCNVCNMLPMDCIDLFSRMHNLNVSMSVVALAKEIGSFG